MLELYRAENCPYGENGQENLTVRGQSVVVHTPCTAGGDVRDEQTRTAWTTIGGEDRPSFPIDSDREVTRDDSDDIVAPLDNDCAYPRTHPW